MITEGGHEMAKGQVIKRYLEPEVLAERAKTDLRYLVEFINGSGGEYNLQLRENYFNIYYQGNSLAKVTPNENGTYSVAIHEEFAWDRKILERLEPHSELKPSQRETHGAFVLRKFEKLEPCLVNRPSQCAQITDQLKGHFAAEQAASEGSPASDRSYVLFRVKREKLRQFFQKSNLERLGSKIRARGYGEEIVFEQALITDNPATQEFIIIDRQVADHDKKAQMDLLALKRDSADKPFRFLVIELKLGRNRELSSEVAEQVKHYVDHIKKHIDAYAKCYEENYRQKRQLGLLAPYPKAPEKIDIDRSEESVEGLIVVVGYSELAEKAIKNLRKKIAENGGDIKVQQIKNKIKLDDE